MVTRMLDVKIKLTNTRASTPHPQPRIVWRDGKWYYIETKVTTAPNVTIRIGKTED